MKLRILVLILSLYHMHTMCAELEEEKEQDFIQDISEQDEQGNTLLHRAIQEKRISDIQQLLERSDIDLSITNQEGQNIVHALAQQPQLPESVILQALKKIQLQPTLFNIRDKQGNTPLHRAIEYSYNMLIRLLLEPSDLTLKNNSGDTPAHIAARTGNTTALVDMFNKDTRIINSQNNEGNTPLHIAAANGHSNTVSRLLSMPGIEVNITNTHGHTPLHLAINSPNQLPDQTRTLLIAQTNLHIKDQNGNTPLHAAILANRADIVRNIVHHTAVVDWTNNQGNTPLHLAAQLAYGPFVQLLLQHSAHANALNGIGQKPIDLTKNETIIALLKPHTSHIVPVDPTEKIIYGTKTHDYQLVQDGIKKGGNINQQDGAGNTPLHAATQLDNTSIAHTLLDQGADLSIQNNNGDTAIHTATSANSQLFQHIMERARVEQLHIQNNRGNTALHTAVKKKNSNKIKKLIDADKTGKSLSIQNNEGKTAEELTDNPENKNLMKKKKLDRRGLLVATQLLRKQKKRALTPHEQQSEQENQDSDPKNLATMQELLQAIEKNDLQTAATILAKKIITPTTKTVLGSTPLHEAVLRAHLDMINLLLDQNPDITVKNSANQTILEQAIAQNNTPIAQQILRYARARNSLPQLLSDKKEDGKTLLHTAAQQSNAILIEELLTAGLAAQNIDNRGNLALHYAAENPNIPESTLVRLLGPDNIGINLPGHEGNTPLHFAISRGSLNTIQLLIKHGAHINAQNTHGITPLMLSTQRNTPDLFALLMQQNAALYPQNAAGETILDYVQKSPLSKTLEQLLTSRGLPIAPSLHEFLNPYYIQTLAKSRFDIARSLLLDAHKNALLPITLRNQIGKPLITRHVTRSAYRVR